MRLAAIFVVVMSWSDAALACSGCGCRGGPGYRGPNGQCVGHAALRRVCGEPPTLRCQAEGNELMRLMQLEKAKKPSPPVAAPIAPPPR